MVPNSFESPFSYSIDKNAFPKYFIAFLCLYIHINTPRHKIMYFTHTSSICSCLEMALFGISLNSRGIVCQGLIRRYLKKKKNSLVWFWGTWIIHKLHRGPIYFLGLMLLHQLNTAKREFKPLFTTEPKSNSWGWVLNIKSSPWKSKWFTDGLKKN